MRLLALILVAAALILLGVSAYVESDVWKLALYADVVTATLALTVVACLVLEAMVAPRAAWIRAGIAAAAGLWALGVSEALRPGSLDEFPFRDPTHSALSVSALGFAAAGLLLGGAAQKLPPRGARRLGGAAMIVALVALRGWLNLRS